MAESDAVRSFYAAMAQSKREMDAEKARFIAWAREHGAVAGHPNGGWNDRALQKLVLCYPDFMDQFQPLEVGALIALRSHDSQSKWTLVKVEQVEHGWTGTIYYHYSHVKRDQKG